MVTPFAWSQPHPVNEHVRAASDELRRRGHEVVVLAPSNRAADLAQGRRALRRLGAQGEPLSGVVALGPAVPISRKSRLGVPIGVRANLELALGADSFDVLHAHEPGMPSLSYLALRDSRALSVATFHSPDRLGYPPGKKQRERLLSRIDGLTAVGEETLTAARERFPGDYRALPYGIELDRFKDARPANRFLFEWRADELPRARAARRELRGLPDWQLVFVRTSPLSGRPYVPRALRDRVTVRTALDGESRARLLAGAAGLVPAQRGVRRFRAEAAAAGVPLLDPPGAQEQPELVGAALGRLASDPEWRRGQSEAARRSSEALGSESLADEL